MRYWKEQIFLLILSSRYLDCGTKPPKSLADRDSSELTQRSDWLSGKAHFESNGRTFSFSSLVNPEIRCLGRITSLDRDWIIRVGEGAIRSVNFPTIPTTFIEIGASRGRDVYGTTVKGPAVDHLHALAFTKGFSTRTIHLQNDQAFYPTVELGNKFATLTLAPSTTSQPCQLQATLDHTTVLALEIVGVSLLIDLQRENSSLRVMGLIDKQNSSLSRGDANFQVQSRSPNEVFSATISAIDEPRFHHEFNVVSSVLRMGGLISGYSSSSVPHDIWISTDGTIPAARSSDLVASNDFLSGLTNPFRVRSEIVCTVCNEPRGPDGLAYFATRLHRSGDLLDLRMEFYNFELDAKSTPGRLVPRDLPGPCLVIVVLAPQHVSEDAFLEGAGCDGETPGPSNAPIGAKSARPSRLVFEYPKALGALDLNGQSVLDFGAWEPRSSGLARHPNLIAAPQWNEPAIEAPRGLILQQGPGTRWRANVYDEEAPNRHVLFNIDLVSERTFDDQEPDLVRRARVVPVWSDAFIECGVIPSKTKLDFWRSLCRRINLGGSTAGAGCEILDPAAQGTAVTDSSALDVIQETTLRTIVRLSHDLTLCPEPPKANHMILTQLGAWTELDGYWPKTKARAAYTDMKSWRHRMTQGRTQFDKVERRGFLYPFGHRLTLIEETNRRQHELNGATYAVLKKKWYVVVEQSEIDLSPPRLLKGASDETFRMPFRNVRIVETSTPNLDPPAIQKITDTNACNTYFWGSLCGQQFLFNLKGTDWRGREIDFKAPLLFVNDVGLVSGDLDAQSSDLNASLATIYTDATRHIDGDTGKEIPRLSRSFADLSGQLVALQQGYQQGDTDFEVGRARFAGEGQLPPPTEGLEACELIVDQPTENTAFFYPVVEVAEARAPTLSKATAASGGTCWLFITDPVASGNSFEVVAVKHPATTSKAQTLQALISDANAGSYPDMRYRLPFDRDNDRTGGVSGPTPNIDAWSRIKGPLGIGNSASASLRGETVPPADVTMFHAGGLSPSDYFDLNARILGVIPLSEIVAALGLDATTPSLLDFFAKGGDVEDSIGYSYDWDTPLKEWDGGVLTFGPREAGQAKLVISGGVMIELAIPPKTYGAISGRIADFQVTLQVAGNGIRADFNQIALHAPLGEKISFDVDIEKVTFIGPLMEFVQKLKESLGLGNGFDIVLSATSVTAQLGPFELPGIGFGVFSMSQISFFAACDIYFKGNKPILFTFKFSTFDRPFTLAVAFLGGRGHFLIAIDTSGVQEISASLEFGATTEFNFGGFAHGNLFIMGGVFYSSKRLLLPSSKNPNVMVSETVISVQIYIRAGGSLSCFGFITVSLDVHLGLDIAKRGGSTVAYGTATLTFSVKIGFFKKSFSITFSKELPGSSSSEQADRLTASQTFQKVAEFQLSLSPASPDTVFSSHRDVAEGSGYEASPAQITDGSIYATPCDHEGATCGPDGLKAISKAQFRYYWHSFGENRKARY
ncbi:hypothetical protein PZB21_28480 [Rhizobium sp. CBK13]|uniref:hypothetical protein n=1 Tax=Rhizobium sp. CBK13 TaxID=3031399 RepID=UPI0023AFAEB4|nr:hypothetical protein [Rhizobium sp. CBK13]MDE8763078.1 hypothetical protein [Rhizobium sp. CBK13]